MLVTAGITVLATTALAAVTAYNGFLFGPPPEPMRSINTFGFAALGVTVGSGLIWWR